jgi:hypothetical protein
LAAYDFDLEFLQSIAFHIFQFWSVLNTAGDTWWLSQLSLTHLATHELRDFKQTLEPTQRKQLENIIYTISPAEHFDRRRPQQTWNSVVEFIKRHHRRLSSRRFEDVWKFFGIALDQKIESRFLGSLRLIIHAILSNTRHSDYEKNAISLRKEMLGEREVITIQYSSNVSYVDPETLLEIEQRFRIPSLSADGWHFGLFLIGVHARILGGYIEIDPACRREFNYGPFAYLVRVPVPETAHD